MKMDGFTKITNIAAANTCGGGGGLILLGTLLPLILPAISNVVTSFKLLFSDKGEVKAKDGSTSKWETYEDKSTTSLHFIK